MRNMAPMSRAEQLKKKYGFKEQIHIDTEPEDSLPPAPYSQCSGYLFDKVGILPQLEFED